MTVSRRSRIRRGAAAVLAAVVLGAGVAACGSGPRLQDDAGPGADAVEVGGTDGGAPVPAGPEDGG